MNSLTKYEARVKKFGSWKKMLRDYEYSHIKSELDYELNAWNEYFKDRVLKNIDHVWVLIFSYKGLKKIYNDKSNSYRSFYDETRVFALGCYVLLYPTIRGSKYDFIDVCDTCIANHNLLNFTIKQIEKKKGKRILPLHIIKSSVKYWKKYLEQFEIDDYNLFLKSLSRECDWRHLLEHTENTT